MLRKALLASVLLVPLAAHAQNGQPGNGINPPAGGSGVLGFLSGIYQQLTGTIVIAPGPLTLVPLDIASVGTGGTAVNAISAGHATKGGLLITANAAGMCVDPQATAGTVTGTPSTTVCVAQNQPFNIPPTAHAISVNSTASSVALAGGAYN